MSTRGIVLIAAALVLCVGLLGVQLAAGGGDFVPQRSADPCRDLGRTAPDDLPGLVETVVVTGVNDAACELGVSRERLLLSLLSPEDRAELAREAGTDENGLAETITEGLGHAIDRLDAAGQLPKPAALLPSLADQLGIPDVLVNGVPDVLLDRLPPTADMLRWSLDRIDVATILEGLDDGRSLESILRDALIQGVKDDARAWLKDVLPGGLGGLFG